MGTQWIYRVCDSEGGGPYRGYGMDFGCIQSHYKNYDRPMPCFGDNEGESRFGYQGTHYFGFKDRATLRKWFSNKCRRGLSTSAFIHKILVNVDIKCSVLEAFDKRQIAFDSEAVLGAVCLDVETFKEKFKLTQEELREMDYYGKQKQVSNLCL